MKTKGFVTIAILLVVSAAALADDSEPVNVAARHRIESKILKETRFYLVHKPPHYDSRKDSFPVLYLLDGDTNIAHTSAAAELLARNGRIPELLIVGVGNTDRERDLSPPLAEGAPSIGKKPGADKFLQFVAEELLPTIERDYRTRPYRILVGHSLGGLVAIYSLVNKPELFNAYIAISPSLWWDNQSLAKSASAFLESHKDLRGDLYMTMGNETTMMLGGAWKLSAALEESKPREFRWQFQRRPEETHGTIPYRSTYDGLQAIFDGWYIADPFAFYDQAGLAGFEKHYAEVSKRIGYTVPIPFYVFILTGQSLAKNGRASEVEPLLKRGLELYPDSPDLHFSLGARCAAQKDRDCAVEHLTKALQIYPGRSDARAQLEKLEVDVTQIVPEFKFTQAQLRAIAGEYKTEDGTGIISIDDGSLHAQASYGGQCDLRAMSRIKLYCVDANVQFLLEWQGSRVKGYTLVDPDYSEYHKKVR